MNLVATAPRAVPMLIALIAALPWLNPFAPGPSPAVAPWLITAFAVMGLLIVAVTSGVKFDVTPSLVASLAWSLVFAGTVSSLIGLLQYFGVAETFEPWIKAGKVGEAYANLRQRNQFATLTNIALVALLWQAACRSGRNGNPEQQRQPGPQSLGLAGMLLAAGLLAAGNAASSSRTGMLQLLLIGGLMCLWGEWQRQLQRRIFIAALGTYVVCLFVLPYLAGFDMSEQGMLARLRDGATACSSRLTLWSNVLHLIAIKPWVGWGWGELDYAHYMTLYNGLRFCEILDNAHNLPLHLAVELGIPVALVVTGALGWLVVRARPWRETDPTRQMAWAVLALIGLHSLVEYPLWYGPFQMTAGLCVLLLWRRSSNPALMLTAESPNYEGKQASANWISACIAIIMIAASGYAAWDYHRISQVYLQADQRSSQYQQDAIGHARKSWLFRNQVEFAELTVTPVTRVNSREMFISSERMLHYSPEPRVIEKAIESAVMLGLDDDALAHLARFRAAFPAEHAAWAAGLTRSQPSPKPVN